jgi:hypothetical protein
MPQLGTAIEPSMVSNLFDIAKARTNWIGFVATLPPLASIFFCMTVIRIDTGATYPIESTQLGQNTQLYPRIRSAFDTADILALDFLYNYVMRRYGNLLDHEGQL